MREKQNTIRQYSVGSLLSRAYYVEERISVYEDTELDDSVRVNHNILKMDEWNIQDLWDPIKKQDINYRYTTRRISYKRHRKYF